MMNPLLRKVLGLAASLGILLLPLVVESPYYLHLLIMVGMNAMLAMTFIILLRTGLISLCIATFWGVGAYASALLAMKLDLSFWLALPLAAAITGIVSLCLGFALVRFSGFGFLIQTVVLGEIAVLVLGNVRYFGGYEGIMSIPPIDPIALPLLGTIDFAGKAPLYYLMLFLFGIVTCAVRAFYAAWTGRAWMAIGLNQHLAESIGVNVFRYRLLAFVVAGAVAGLAGSFYAHYYGTLAPTTFSIFKTIYIHVFAILGGIGFPVLGPVAGTFFMTCVPELLRMTREVEPIFTGFIIILAVLFLPDGLLSLVVRRSLGTPGEGLGRMAALIRGIFSFGKR
jgi:branched-chain amino acid transport system permease protein